MKTRETRRQEPISELNYEKREQDMIEAIVFVAAPCTRQWNIEDNLKC
jgi:hypothetical protein